MLIIYILIIILVILVGCMDTPPLQGGLFWTFICPYKCPFCPLRVGVLKHEMQNTQKWGCDHNAHKTYFWSEKHVTDFFWGSVGASKLVG